MSVPPATWTPPLKVFAPLRVSEPELDLMIWRLLEQLASEALERFHHQDDLLQAVEQCEQALRPRDRELLQARYQGDRSIDQLSQATGRTAAAIRQTLCRIRGALLTCIQRRLASQEERV